MTTKVLASSHEHHDSDGADVFGFWLYILTDCIIFGCLFATYLVLHHPHAFGPSLKDHINLYFVLGGTFLLLTSNLTFGLAVLAMNKDNIGNTRFWLILTFLLGAGFVGMEVSEFVSLVNEGYSWNVSASASAFFTLVGTHGLHVCLGLMWVLTMIFQVPYLGINKVTKKRMVYLGLFWNFLDLVWIFLFSVVYLMGVLR